MKNLYTISAALMGSFFLLFSITANAQVLEVTNGDPFTPQNLITNIFLGEGVEVQSVTYQGDEAAVGFFKDGINSIGIDRGLVMTTGVAETAGFQLGVAETGGQFASVTNASEVDDPDLAAIAGNPALVRNAAIYTITFVPIADTLRFNYAFGSEEYPEYTCSIYNDIFGFFISGPGINGPYENNAENIATIPGTNRPVTINNVNSGMVGANGTLGNCQGDNGSLNFSEYYVDNNGSNNQPVYDGFTTVLTAEAIVMPCSTYTIKLAICDITDGAFDSGVFLEAKSFGTGSLDVQTSTVSLDGSVVEGCAQGVLSFSLPSPVEADLPLDYTILGTAINGVDYVTIPENLFIPAGDSVVSVPIIAIEDGIDEGLETILIDVQLDPCNRDTFTILVRDNPLVERDLGPDTTICQGASVQLDGTLPVPLPPPPNFSNTNDLLIAPTNVPINSEVDVVGVIPPILGPGVIKSVCIDSLTHRWIDDLDVYLFAPNGQFMELTTDNGGNGGNGLGPDFFINTCFTEEADSVISAPGPFAPPEAVPFTGEWQPEGVWSDLYGGPSNGTWSLQLIDDTNGLEGTLHSWSICFNPLYSISYRWEPSAGLSCDDCPNPIATPDVTTTYVMTATDSYGCTYQDEITIFVNENLPAPTVSCTNISSNSLEIVWDLVAGATGYEVSVDGMPFVSSNNGPTSHVVSGLSLGQMVTFMVTTVGPCEGDTATVTCQTLDCTPPTTNATVVNASCSDADDGSITVDAMTSDPPLTYTVNGMDMGTTNIYNNLTAGMYNIVVTDNLGCSNLLMVEITAPEPIVTDPVSLAGTSCPGEADGSATVMVSGGAGGYSFSWDSGSTDSIATNLTVGPHTVVITDANNCTTTAMVMISEPDAVVLTASATQVTCNSADDGSATVVATGGTPPFTYIWDAGAGGQTTDTAIDLAGGMYTVTVTDDNNCQAVTSVEVLENPVLQLEVSSTDVSCAENVDGTVSVVAGGGTGTGTYTYVWNDLGNGSTIGTTANVNDLPPGDYEIIVTDGDGCTATDMIVVDAPEPLAAQVESITAPNCAGEANGTSSLTAFGGTGIYTFTWFDGMSIPMRSDLPAGTYFVTVTDENSCEVEVEVVIPSVEELVLDISASPVTCNGGMDGTASVMATGGTGTYSYEWSDGQMAADAVDLPAGMVSVMVTDGNGCTETIDIDITQNTSVELQVDGTDPLCNGGADGQATVTATGGTETFTYTWSNGENSNTTNTLPAGTHDVTVTDGNGCEAVIAITLDEPSPISATTEFGLISCNGEPDGTAMVVPEGGTPPYSYLWDDPAGQTTAEATGLTEGNYNVIVTDANGCTFDESVEIVPTPAIELTISTTDITCNAGSDGSIGVEAVGGTPPYTYEWNGGAIPPVTNPAGLSVGVYDLIVTDANGCFVEQTISLSEPGPILLSTNTSSTTCEDTADGAVDLSIQGGAGTLSYSWSNGAQTEDIVGLLPGNYGVTVTDENGCFAIATASVSVPSRLEADFSSINIDCFGASNGGIESVIRGGVPPYDFAWSNGATTEDLVNIVAGDYELVVTDANGCQLTETISVLQPEAPLSAAITADSVSCFGLRDGVVRVEPSGGTPFYQYSIDGDNFGGSSTFIGLEAGSYNIYIEDSRGCTYLTDVVEVGEPAAMDVRLRGEEDILFGDTAMLEAEVLNSRGILFYEWTPIDTSCVACPIQQFNIEFQTSFKVKVTDEYGCFADDILTVNVRKNTEVAVPTGFTPNGDGTNDLLLVHGREGIVVTTFRIFDRWGEMVYEDGGFGVNTPVRGWDGTFRGEPVNGGVYLWQVEVVYLDGSTGTLQGQTTVIR